MRVRSVDIGFRNLAYCDAEWNYYCNSNDVNNKIYQPIIIHEWILKDLMPNVPNINKIVTEKLVEKIVEFIKDIVLKDDNFDVLVVERQKAGAAKMITLSHSIQCVCQLMHSTKPVVFYSAKHKLNVLPSWFNKKANDKTPAIVSAINLSDGHYKNKRIAIAVTEEILKTSSQLKNNLDWFNSNKSKQDDIADAFLQALAYIYNNTPKEATKKESKKRKVGNVDFLTNKEEPSKRVEEEKIKKDIPYFFRNTKSTKDDINVKNNSQIIDLTYDYKNNENNNNNNNNSSKSELLDFSDIIDLTKL